MANALEMKKRLASGELVLPRAVLLYGPAKSGKTYAALALAEHYKILYLDGENGGETMFQLPASCLANIEWVRIHDTRKEPHFVEAIMRFQEGETVKICEAHGKTTCSKCIATKAPFKSLNIADYPPSEWIVVTDSFTQCSLSADWFITNKQKIADGEKFGYDEFRLKGFYLERILGAMQVSAYNNLLITHEQGLDQQDGTEKLTPSGGTKNFARNNAKYFGAVIYMEVQGNKHIQNSMTTKKANAITGNRANVDTNVEGLISLYIAKGLRTIKASAKVAPKTKEPVTIESTTEEKVEAMEEVAVPATVSEVSITEDSSTAVTAESSPKRLGLKLKRK